jgi:hypothetical protein
MVNSKGTHLTSRQFEVLKGKLEGKSLSEIAKEIGTSRSNVSSIAKAAERNVQRAKNTLKLIRTIEWPIRVDVKAGTNLYDVYEKVFREADEKGIKVIYNYPELVMLIIESLGREKIKRRKITTDLSIMVCMNGEVVVL